MADINGNAMLQSKEGGGELSIKEAQAGIVDTVNESENKNNLPRFDENLERRLRWKIDLYVIPTVTILYLFCFIDRANIGKHLSPSSLPGGNDSF
ncbi:hypothetical protein FE257_010098 [Aspergillus nanangensis]|uniref:Uncharacterized protein n=1 Tax=Aspergillus nanangensis TaxID=2582783 RepID=A0AAD4CJ86_ASPNN|nr:hypothetical protein FE257_010098 [Aspergillus nanangensis]